MPDETANAKPAAPEYLPVALLAEAAADPRRRWSARGNCTDKDPEIFFPPRGELPAQARAICTPCEVRRHCLAYAVAADEKYGVWGGLDLEERRTLRRRLRRTLSEAQPAAGTGR